MHNCKHGEVKGDHVVVAVRWKGEVGHWCLYVCHAGHEKWQAIIGQGPRVSLQCLSVKSLQDFMTL